MLEVILKFGENKFDWIKLFSIFIIYVWRMRNQVVKKYYKLINKLVALFAYKHTSTSVGQKGF